MTKNDVILDGLNAAQKEAVVYPGKHLLVFAGPGTGKTRVITHRVAYLALRQGIDPETILAITFTNKAAQELKERLNKLLGADVPSRPWAGTFHGFSHWLLRRHWHDAGLPKDFVIYDADDQKTLMREMMTAFELPISRAGVFLDIIQRLKDDLMDAKSYSIHTGVNADASRSQIAKIYLAYQHALRERGALDFGDLILEANILLREKPEVLDLYHRRFYFVFVDEYQDVNRAQYALVKLLTGTQGSLTCVADDDQVIYEWRNANPKYTLEFETEFKGAGSVVLTENYRSTPEIIGPARRLIEHNENRKRKDLQALRPPGPGPEVREVEDEKTEAASVARAIQRLLIEDGVAPSQIAVFYRLNAQSRNFEIELRSAGVPYRLIGSVGFYARREVKDILAFVRLLVNPKDEVSLWRTFSNINAFSITRDAIGRVKAAAQDDGANLWDTLASLRDGGGGLSKKAAAKIGRFLDAYNALSLKRHEQAGLAALFEAALVETKYLEGLEDDRAWNVWELVESAREYEAQNPGADLLSFLNDTSLLASVSADNNRSGPVDSVSLMTAHLAKGLEFRAVFLTGLEEGLFPFKISKTDPKELEEERRLFYVGMTRAKDWLSLCYAKRRMLFGSETNQGPSRFLFEAGLLQGKWASRPAVRRGARVKHPLFGEGRIVAMSGAEPSVKVTVNFINGATRKFLVGIAPLEVL